MTGFPSCTKEIKSGKIFSDDKMNAAESMYIFTLFICLAFVVTLAGAADADCRKNCIEKSLASNFTINCNSTCFSSKDKRKLDIRRPSRPRNFTAKEAWFDNGRIFVNLTWAPPLDLDLPVRRYRLIYKKHVDGTGQHYDIIREMRKKVPGKTTHAVLKMLYPNTVYIVRIQALLTSRRKKIKGKWGTMLLKTPPLIKQNGPNTSAVPALQPSLAPPPTAPVVTIKTAVNFFCRAVYVDPNGYLSAVLRWTVPETVEGVEITYKPEKCRNGEHRSSIPKKEAVKAQRREIVLTHLYPSCAYIVKMTPYYSNRTADKERSISFSTEINDPKSLRPKLQSKKKAPSSAVRFYCCYLNFLFTIFNVVFLIL